MQARLPSIWSYREDRGHHLLVFFRFQRTGRVDYAAARADGAKSCAKNGTLPFGLAVQIVESKPVADLGVAAQCAGAAARNVDESEVEGGVLINSRRVGETAFDSIAERGKALAQLLEALRAEFAGYDACLQIALGEDERLVAGRGAGIEDSFRLAVEIVAAATGEFGDRAASLHPECAVGLV